MKPGGNAYKLFEVLRERDAQVASKHGEPSEPALKKFTPVQPETARPATVLLPADTEEKQEPARPAAHAPLTLTAPQVAATPVIEPKPARKPLQPARGVIGHYRGKALVVKYDVAMVVVFFMMGLLVIAYVWGFSAGKGGAREEMARQQKAAEATATPEKPVPPIPPQPGQRKADDGEGMYCLRLMTSTRTGIEGLKDKLAEKGYPHVLALPVGGTSTRWVLYLGQFKTLKSAEEYRKYVQDEEYAYLDATVVGRP
jgi:hypothetical protein